MVGVPVEQWNGADATKQLEATIKRAQLENAKQQTSMLRLTIATAFFAFGALVLSLLQLCVSMKGR